MGPGDLSAALAPLISHHDERLIIGRETFDDAGVFVLSEGLALVQTVDFFAPIVDDPYTFGQIAAANALSDVYAMGGEPLTALNIVAFPTGQLPLSVLTDILRGGHDKVHEAGAVVVGGHSVVDDELKFGLAVTGIADPQKLLTNAAAMPGDRLVLTKPIGTGILVTAVKKEGVKAYAAEYERMIRTMSALNRDASREALAASARCATDITGFGLLGHCSHISRSSAVTLEIFMDDVPILPGTREALARGARTGGAERNLEYLQSRVGWGNASDEQRALFVDPQTSGGLLVALPATAVRGYLSRVPGAAEIGSVLPRGTHDILLR